MKSIEEKASKLGLDKGSYLLLLAILEIEDENETKAA